MKRKCKNVNILDKDYIRKAYVECMSGKNKSRGDILIFTNGYQTEDEVVDLIYNELVSRKLVLPPIRYKLRYDTGKIRTIGVQNIKCQIYDYIAVNGLMEVFEAVGRWQCASVKGRGPICAKRHVERLMNDSECKYFLKGDIKKYFDSIDHEIVLNLLRKRVKNPDLMWLVEQLVNQFEGGLSIGSYLSQWLANWLTSFLYHRLEECHYIRKSRRYGGEMYTSYVKGMCFYMDDFVIFTSSQQGLRAIRRTIDEVLAELHLSLKKEPQIGMTSKHCVDLVGFKIRKDFTTIRSRDFIRARRAFKHFAKRPTVHGARRCLAYYGFFIHSNSRKYRLRHKIDKLMSKAKRMVSWDGRNQKSNLRLSKGTCIDCTC